MTEGYFVIKREKCEHVGVDSLDIVFKAGLHTCYKCFDLNGYIETRVDLLEVLKKIVIHAEPVAGWPMTGTLLSADAFIED